MLEFLEKTSEKPPHSQEILELLKTGGIRHSKEGRLAGTWDKT